MSTHRSAYAIVAANPVGTVEPQQFNRPEIGQTVQSIRTRKLALIIDVRGNAARLRTRDGREVTAYFPQDFRIIKAYPARRPTDTRPSTKASHRSELATLSRLEQSVAETTPEVADHTADRDPQASSRAVDPRDAYQAATLAEFQLALMPGEKAEDHRPRPKRWQPNDVVMDEHGTRAIVVYVDQTDESQVEIMYATKARVVVHADTLATDRKPKHKARKKAGVCTCCSEAPQQVSARSKRTGRPHKVCTKCASDAAAYSHVIPLDAH